MRYFVHLAYSGTNYRGWQRQKQTSATVQQVLEDTFSKMLKHPVTIFGCGRTDAEVHASQYFFHFDTDSEFDYDPINRINKMLPSDISVFEFIEVENDRHAQYDATKRTYKYFMHFIKDPFRSDKSVWTDDHSLDENKMREAVELVKQQNDFASMCKKPNQYKSTICNLTNIEMEYSSEGIVFTITANRFLQSMVRLLVGRIIDIGKGRMTLNELEKCFKTNKPPKFPLPAYPQGLYLAKVEYPFLSS